MFCHKRGRWSPVKGFLRPVNVVTAAMLSSAVPLGTQSSGAGAKKDLLVLSDLPTG
jgi:hypothetical protein